MKSALGRGLRRLLIWQVVRTLGGADGRLLCIPLHPDVVPFAVVNLSAATHFYVYLLAIMVSLVYIRRADCDLTRWQTVCTDCGGTVIEYDTAAGNGFCVQCGTVVEENTIVNEVRSNVMQYVCNIRRSNVVQVTFGETSTGAAMVQGSFVAQGASA